MDAQSVKLSVDMLHLSLAALHVALIAPDRRSSMLLGFITSKIPVTMRDVKHYRKLGAAWSASSIRGHRRQGLPGKKQIQSITPAPREPTSNSAGMRARFTDIEPRLQLTFLLHAVRSLTRIFAAVSSARTAYKRFHIL